MPRVPRPGAAEVPLVRHDRQLACPNGHGFDIARQGYVNLAGGAPPANADTAPMIDARQRFLDSGVYEPIRQAVSHASDAAHWLVEVGAGTGWYLDGVLTHRRDAVGLATDVSVAAAKRAARSGLASVVADTWAGLPIRSASVDAVLCVFAPRSAAEFARVLAPGGRAVVAWPTPRHLAALRERLGLLNVATDKDEQLVTQFGEAGLNPADRELVEFSAECTAQQVADLVGMGPNAFHDHAPAQVPTTIDVSVEVGTFLRAGA
ncbi:methyltransferase domain-containing protein [Propionibacterium freudenreichii]|uniref:putative RNA methyltransferase n=1 Tax=Propionibacterium freudenreichii TaxID=1744 RepID=UPI0022B8FD8E|nr:methyltransferase domain-containing protein [Propionibacterium freudenreichii]WBF61378.1 methyltransferase domain-containing protein [Propionibacterium freudenreichii]